MAALIIDFSQVSANPLNPIGSRLRSLILDQLEVARQSAYFTHVILHGGGHHFSAGADLTEFALGSDFSTTLIEVVQAIENSPKPVIAAVTGKALGGGMELALSCHYRIATEDSSWGLPEVKVGLIPGAGGTQRLPKLIGMQAAIEMILSGKTHSGKKTLDLGIVDALVGPGEDLLQVAHRWGNWASLIPVENRRVGQLSNKETPAQVRALCQKAARKLPPSELGGESHHCALQALEASTQPLEHGMQVEEEMVMTCLMSEQGMARRHVFFAIRQAQRPIHSPPSQHPLLASLDNKCSVGVIGAGTMGSGIAMVLLRAGYSKVLLVDINAKALATGVAFLNKTIHTLVQRKKISSLKGKHLQKTLVPSSKLEDLKDCDLVVEAVVENMKIKQSIFKTLDKVTPKQCILLSNTSTLNIDQMSQVLAPSRQAIFAGWHFFSPANIMPLVEICVGQKTSPSTVGLLQALTKKIGKIGVPVGICYGFVGNRMVRPYGGESVALLTEGHATVERVDQSLKQFGMALGPLAMGDLAGNDVGYLIRQELGWVRDPKTGIVPNRRPARYSELADDLVTKIGRLGQKVGKGWSDYDAKVGGGYTPIPSKEVAMFVEQYVVQQGPLPPQPLSSRMIVERVLFPLVNEGFKCLEENIAQKPSDIDVIYIFGYGFPAWRGGPMYWAENDVGLDNLLRGLQNFSQQFHVTEHYVPSRLLEECVRQNMTVTEYYEKGLHNKGFSKL